MQKANISWVEDVPVSDQFNDPYFSANNGLDETRHVFLRGNRLPERFCNGFHIAELGFGTGLNLLAAWTAWEEAGQTTPLIFTSFEAFPLSKSDIARALSPWPELADRVGQFLKSMQSDHRVDLPTLKFRMIHGDANQTLPNWAGHADAWFLDGFSPSKNPELWSPELLAEVARHASPDATCATYTAAGHVRRNLTAAGFTVERIKGHANKRHMTVGRMQPHAE